MDICVCVYVCAYVCVVCVGGWGCWVEGGPFVGAAAAASGCCRRRCRSLRRAFSAQLFVCRRAAPAPLEQSQERRSWQRGASVSLAAPPGLQEKAALQDVLRRKGGPDGGSAGGSFQLPPPEAAQQQQPWMAGGLDAQQQAWAEQQAWVPTGASSAQQAQQGGAYGYAPYDPLQQQPGSAWGEAPQQQWDYQSGGPIQPAEYEPYSDAGPAGTSDSGADFFAVGASGTAGTAPPTEFTFPASYEDGGAAAQDGGSAWGGGSEQQQQGQQQRGQGGGAHRRGGSNFDGMDDW